MKFADLFKPSKPAEWMRIVRIVESPTFNTGKDLRAENQPLAEPKTPRSDYPQCPQPWPGDDPDAPHLAGWLGGRPIYRGTVGEWRASFRAAVSRLMQRERGQ